MSLLVCSIDSAYYSFNNVILHCCYWTFFIESGLKLVFKPVVTSVIVASSNLRCHLMFLFQRLKALACSQC